MNLENNINPTINTRRKLVLNLKQNKMIFYTIFAMLVKCTVFLWLLGSVDNIDNNIYITDAFSCIYILFLISFSFLFKSLLRKWYLFLINFSVSFLLMIDLFYFKVYETFPSLYSLIRLKDLMLVSSGAFSLFKIKYLCFFIDIPIIFAAIMVRKQAQVHKRNIIIFAALFIISCTGMFFMPTNSGYLEDVEYFSTEYSPFAYHVADAHAFFLEGKQVKLTEEDKSEIQKWYYEKNKEGLSNNECKGIFQGKNLILIQFESLEDFVINRKINGTEITPNLNRLISNSFYFSNIYQQVGDGTSSDADLLVNTSIYPVKSGSTFYKYGENSYNSIASILKKYNYFSQDIYPADGAFWNWEQNQNALGYDRFFDVTYFGIEETLGMGLPDKDLFEQTIPILSKTKQPFLTYICNLSSHMPFELPEEYRELGLYEELNDSYLGGYFESVHYSDKCLGEFIQGLQQNNLLDNTVIVVFGDHGGASAYYKKETSKLKPRQDWWIPKDLKVPLIIYSKDLKGKEVATNGGLIDVLPTLFNLLGVDENYYKNAAMGRDLLNTNQNFVVKHDGTYIGDIKNASDKQHALEGLNVADMIIRGNYFKNQ